LRMRGLTSPTNRCGWHCAWRFALVLACIPLSARADSEALRRDFYFQTTDTEQGLAQSTVMAFLQDRSGFIWIGTVGGLQKYDGYGFDSYEHSGDDPGSPPEGPVSALAEDDSGTLWVGTTTLGLLRRAPSSDVFRRVPTGAGGAVPTNVQDLLFDPGRGLWVGGTAGVVLLDPTDGRVLRNLPIVTADKNVLQVRRLCLGADGTLWVASSAGLWTLPPHAENFEPVAEGHLGNVDDLLIDRDGVLYAAAREGLFRIANAAAEHVWPTHGDSPVTALAQDARGRLWLAVRREGLVLLDAQSGATQWLRPGGGLPGSPPDAIVKSLRIDRSGLLWIGTFEHGISRVDPNGTLFSYIADRNPQREQTASNYIRAVLEDADGRLWLGTEGDGLKRYDPATNRFDYYSDVIRRADPDVAPVSVGTLAAADNGNVWVGTSSQGVALLDPKRREATFLPMDASGTAGVPDTEIRNLLHARDGSLWIGTGHAGLVQYDPARQTWRPYRAGTSSAGGGLTDDRIIALREDRAGNIWAGGLTGLNLIDPHTHSVRVFHNDPDDAHSLAGNLVRTIQESADGKLWIGTQAGLSRLDSLDPLRAHFTRWLPRNGLPSGTVYAIADDGAGRLWLSTNRGISSFDRIGETFHTFALADGLQGMEFNGNSSAVLRDGRLAFGGINGLNLFSPQAVTASRYAAPVVFTNVRIGNAQVRIPEDGSGLSMAAADRVVRFEFAALDFASPERNRFAYQLEGFDDHWIEAGTRHDATYTNLDSGRYTFKVRASNHDGYWNEHAASLDLQVTPPLWESPAAKAAYVLALACGVLLWWRALRRRRSEQLLHHRDLQEREDRLRLALWGSGDDFWDWDIPRGEFVVTGSGDLFQNASRKSRVFSQAWFREHLHPEDLPKVEQRLEEHINQKTETFTSEHRLRNHNGDWVWAFSRAKIVERDQDGQPVRIAGTARDISATRAADSDRRIAEEVIRSMTEAVAVSDLDFGFLHVNPAFTRITGWREEEIIGRSTALLNCSQHPPELYAAMRETLNHSGHWRGELWQRRKDGDEFLSWIEVSEVRDALGLRTHFVSVISDITDRKRTEQELRYLANYDALTGLPNRTLLSERIGHAIVRARRGARKVALLFLDLDRFKHVNDSMGHAVGDRMLKAAGSRLRQVVREGDSVARIGGDEFTVVLEDIANGAEAERVAEKIIAAFEEPLELDNGQEVIISPSIGVSLYPDHGHVPSDLLKFADTAMYQAKERGRKTYMVYTEAMDAAARLRATTVTALRKALERNEFSLVYQPKLSLLDERITGVEALLRWRSADLGNITPGVFIPIAEETGMIIEIGDWVVAQSCAQLARWRDAGVSDITMSINVSVAQLLRGDLIQRLCDVLAEHDIAPNQLELELTESMVMANAEQSITTLRRLKAIGVTLAIDDFGTGYSSLSYLKRLPIDTLKIDKEFVGDITTDPDDEAITATVITMAHSLGLNVVAEGVEIAEQVEYLREQDCDEVQGHWLSYPLPPDECLVFLLERAQRRRVTLGEPH